MIRRDSPQDCHTAITRGPNMRSVIISGGVGGHCQRLELDTRPGQMLEDERWFICGFGLGDPRLEVYRVGLA